MHLTGLARHLLVCGAMVLLAACAHAAPWWELPLPPPLGASGPISHEVRVGLPRGTGFAPGTAVLWDHASVPGGVRLADGTLLIYYVNAYGDTLWVARSTDAGASFRFQPIRFTGTPIVHPVDPCPLATDDGQVLLYVMEWPRAGAGEPNRIRLARSTDGLTFTAEPTVCCAAEAITDPDVLRLPDGRWVMHVSQGHAIWRLFSSDGVRFEWEGRTPLRTEGAVTATVEHAPGNYRLYFSGRGGIWYYESTDGVTWSTTARLGLNEAGAADPSPVRFPAGWRMYYKRIKSGMPRPGGLPTRGPASHVIISAQATDLRQFTYEPGVRVPCASVEAPVALPDGRVLLYYVDAAPTLWGQLETTNVAVSEDGLNFQALGLTIADSPWRKALDPAPLLLPDGRIRLYFYGCQGDPGQAGDHVVASAISTDGVHFTYEGEALRAPGLVDPDVFVHDGVFHMLVYAQGGTLAATSTDGLRFQQAGWFTPGWGTTRPLDLPDGRLALFAFQQFTGPQGANSVGWFSSRDGTNWQQEAERVTWAPAGWQVTDPHVVRTAAGYRMYLKASRAGF